MINITILHGKNGVKGIYKEGKLVATQDKACTEHDLVSCVASHGGDGDYEITDTNADWNTILDLPKGMEVGFDDKVAPKAPETPVQLIGAKPVPKAPKSPKVAKKGV